MKKIISIFLALFIITGILAGCRSGESSGAARDKKLKIVATIFPEYDWVKQILGDKAQDVELTILLDSSADLHSFQPTVDDIIKISTCDLFIYVGGESDRWAEDALKEVVNKDMTVLNLLDILGDSVKEEETVEGMQGKEEEEEPEFDEHVWLSLKNAQIFCAAIADALAKIDPGNAKAYADNAAAYEARLAGLDGKYREAVDSAPVKTVLFGDRFPFRYLTDDYGLEYYAAFAGCSAETEPSFETIIFLAKKTDELGLKSILQIETSDGSVPRAIRDNTATKDQEILILNSLQSTSSDDIKNGVTYISVMEDNLAVLKEALK